MSFKTLHLTNAWHETSGGISTFYKALMEGAERCRHPMRLVVPGEQDKIEDVGEYGRIYHVQAPRAPFNPQYRMMYPPLFLKPDGPIPRILKAERPDLVEINDKYTLCYLGGMLRSRMIKAVDWRPTVVGLSCERMDESMAAYLAEGKLASRFVKEYMKWIYFPFSDQHIAVSHHTAAELSMAARGHKVRRGIWLGPMGVDFGRFSIARRNDSKRSELLESVAAPADSLLLFYGGRLAKEKNLGLLANVMETLARRAPGRYRLLVAGTGAMREDLAAQLDAKAPGDATFLGHIGNREELADLYANVDIFIHPNPKEPFGIAPLEAMASGLPLVAPNSGGLTTYANQTNAWLVEADCDRFADAILSIEADPVGREARVRAARVTAESYSWESATDYFLNLYEELHAITQGAPPPHGLQPICYSTLGDYFGREIETFDEAAVAGR